MQPLDLLRDLLAREGLNASVATLAAQGLLLLAILLLALLTDWVAKRILLRAIRAFVERSTASWDDVLLRHHVFDRLSHLAPAVVVYTLASVPFPDALSLAAGIRRAAIAYIFVVVATTASAFLNSMATLYEQREVAKARPITAYVQILKLAIFLITGILVVSALTDHSPWAFLSGLGALTAVILLVFKDTLLGLVASIQLMTNDMVRVGDWIEMPKYGADGDVLAITLNTVKVQNWDKTISTVPTYALMSESFKNWRGMSQSGGRRIKRALYLDQNSVRFLDAPALAKLERVALLGDYLQQKKVELAEYNQKLAADPTSPVNGRRLTNLGTFRRYIEAYLRQHPSIHKEMTCMVRHLPPGEVGIGLEIYAFSSVQEWARYEAIQADVFDHLLAVTPEFGLRVFQNPTGADLGDLLART